MRTTWTFHTAGRFLFGRHAIDQIGDIAARPCAKRALIITRVIPDKAGDLPNTANGMRVGILTNSLRPGAALVDPLLTVSCPPKVTADSGIDALTHAIEGYTAVDNAVFPLPAGERSVYQGRHPMGDMLAEKPTALIGRHLRRRGSRRPEPETHDPR